MLSGVEIFKFFVFDHLKGAVGSADLKISKSALLSLNHHNCSNTKPITQNKVLWNPH